MKIKEVKTIQKSCVAGEYGVVFDVSDKEYKDTLNALDIVAKYKNIGLKELGRISKSDIVSFNFLYSKKEKTITLIVKGAMIG